MAQRRPRVQSRAHGRRRLPFYPLPCRHRARLGEADAAERPRLARHAHQRRHLLVYRPLADPRYLDPRLDPSPRPLGSIFSFGRDPIVGNAGEGLARAMSARGWLSTWSGLASRAALETTLPEVPVPTLVVAALGDMDIYPVEVRRAFEASGAADESHVELPNAGHYLQPVTPVEEAAHPRRRVVDEVLLPWLRARWRP
jgi:pimeloyl-ACP methyl ester carboxylesterase